MFVMIDAVQVQTQPIEISGLQASGFWPPARSTGCRVLTECEKHQPPSRTMKARHLTRPLRTVPVGSLVGFVRVKFLEFFSRFSLADFGSLL